MCHSETASCGRFKGNEPRDIVRELVVVDSKGNEP